MSAGVRLGPPWRLSVGQGPRFAARLSGRPRLTRTTVPCAAGKVYREDEHGVDVQEVDGEDPGGLGAKELPPGRTERRGAGRCPRRGGSPPPWTAPPSRPVRQFAVVFRRCPRSGFSLARRTTRRAMPWTVSGRPGLRRLHAAGARTGRNLLLPGGWRYQQSMAGQGDVPGHTRRGDHDRGLHRRARRRRGAVRCHRCPHPLTASHKILFTHDLAGSSGAQDHVVNQSAPPPSARGGARSCCAWPRSSSSRAVRRLRARGHPAAHHPRGGAAAAPLPRRSESHSVQFVVEASGDLLIHSAIFERALALGGGRHYIFAPLFEQISRT